MRTVEKELGGGWTNKDNGLDMIGSTHDWLRQFCSKHDALVLVLGSTNPPIPCGVPLARMSRIHDGGHTPEGERRAGVFVMDDEGMSFVGASSLRIEIER